MKIKNKFLNHTVHVVLVLLGTFFMGTGFNLFFAPNNILLGGFGGISTIISDLLARGNIHISMSIIYFGLNIILYIFAVKTLGKKFGIYAIIGIVSYSIFLEICKFPAASNDPLLCSIYGSLTSGIGVGIVIRSGATTGGGDMLGCIINHKNPKISVGWVTIFVNTIVIIISLVVYGLNQSLYSLIGIFIAGRVSDVIIEGPKSIKAYYIISDKAEEIADKLIHVLHRGVTGFDAYGKYSGKKLDVILCLVSGYQISELKQIVYESDPKAFLFSIPVKEALGQGFHKLEKKQTLVFKKQKISQVLPEQNLTLTPSNSTDETQQKDSLT